MQLVHQLIMILDFYHLTQQVTRGDISIISIISIILVTAVTTGAVGGGVLFSSRCTFQHRERKMFTFYGPFRSILAILS